MNPPQKPKKKFLFIGIGVVPKLSFRTSIHRFKRPIFDLKALIAPPPPP